MSTSTKKVAKGAARGAAKKAPASAKKAAPVKASAKPAGAPKPKKFTRDGLWRLLTVLAAGELRRFEVGQKAGFPETTLHSNLTKAEKRKLIEKANDNAGDRVYRITAAGRKALEAYLKKKGTADAPQAKVEAKKPGPKPGLKPGPKPGAKVAAGRPKLSMIATSQSKLPADMASALDQILAPHSIEKLDEKVLLLEALEKKLPPVLAGRIREIATDLRRFG